MNEDKITNLLEEISKNRNKLYDIVKDLEELIPVAKDLIPKDKDFRSKFIVAERMDVVTRLYDTILKYRTEINKQVKDEITLRQKTNKEEDLADWISRTDV